MAKRKKVTLTFAGFYTLYFIFNIRPIFLSDTLRQQLLVLVYALLLITCLVLYKEDLKTQWDYLRKTWKKAGLYTLLGFGLDTLLTTLFGLLGAFLAQQLQISQDLQNDTSVLEFVKALPLPITFLTIVVMGPIVEEFFFRQFLLGDLKDYLPQVITLGLSSLLFALTHVHQLTLSEVVGAIPYLGSGLAYAFIYLKTKNVYCTTILHILNNAMIFFLL